MKYTLFNNPISWVIYAVLSIVILLLALNYFTKGEPIKGFPECITQWPESVDGNSHLEPDSVVVRATNVYNAKGLKKLLHGEGYRKAWEAPVKVKVVMLDTLKGGLRPIKAGGGNQTRSLALIDSAGHKFTLRSVNKNPVSLVPSWAYNIGIDNIVTEGISAGHPYGALIIPPLAEAAGVLHTHPQLVFVPRQPSLDTFNQKFGNDLYLLEYECKGDNADWLPLPDAREIIETDDVMEALEKNAAHRINHDALVRARLFDILTGDWDRHSKQWGWAVYEKEDGVEYYPIPGDRDNVFYGVGGVFPTLINRPVFESRLRPFRDDIDYFPGMLDNSRSFDEFFLKGVSEQSFITQAQELQKALTDEVIEKAVRQWPDTLYNLNGEEIIRKLKSRRDKLPAYGKEFYKVLQRRLNKKS